MVRFDQSVGPVEPLMPTQFDAVNVKPPEMGAVVWIVRAAPLCHNRLAKSWIVKLSDTIELPVRASKTQFVISALAFPGHVPHAGYVLIPAPAAVDALQPLVVR